MRFLSQASLQLAIAATCICASDAQSARLFGELGSILLSGGNLVVVSPSGTLEIPWPLGSRQGLDLPLSAISPDGEQVASSLRLPDESSNKQCLPSQADCKKQQIEYKSVMGVYSMASKTWKFYEGFRYAGSAAFSPDGRHVAFRVTRKSLNPDCGYAPDSETIVILDLQTGQMKSIPNTTTVRGNRQMSWSPDGRYLAVQFSESDKIPGGEIVLIEKDTEEQKAIGTGTNPSWSPKGDWIAYLANWEEKCMLVHPDGTGAKAVLDISRRSGGWLFYSAVVWSPGEDRLLLNEEQWDGPHHDVAMVDLATGQVTTKSKNGDVALGWVPFSRK